MDNTIQLYVDKKKGKKGYPITSPDRVIDENGVNIKDYVDEAVNNAKLEGDLSDYAKKTDLHSHSNKTILDNITASKVNQWDSKSDFSGDYNDLTNKPTIPSLNGYATEQYVNEEIKKIDVTEQLTDYAKKSELHSHNNKSVLDEITTSKVTEWNNKSTFDGNYNNLANKPTIPTKTSQLTNDSGYITSIPNEYINETELQVHTDQVLSAGEQLVLNGNQTLQNNYNFSQLTYDGAQANNSGGSLLGGVGKRQDTICDYFFAINPNKPLYASFDVKGAVGSRMYAFVDFYDVDKQRISASTVMYQPNTLTRLTQDLKNGDTVVHLEDLTNWKETLTATHQKSFIFWNYTNKQGYTYPPETYSRNMFTNVYTDSSSVDKVNKTITLTTAWNKGTIPTGTYVSQGNNGNNYRYIKGTSLEVTTEWKTISGVYEGMDYTGSNIQSKLPPGTAFAKFGMFLNYSGVADEKVWITNIVVKEDVYSAVEKKADKTYVDTELAKKSDKSHTHSEYITDSELNAKGYLTEHQDISGKVDKVSGYSLVSDTEISRLETLENYDDTEVRELIDETNASLDKGVTFKVVGEGTTVPPLDNVVGNIPTKTSQLINDSGFISSIPSEYVTETELNAKGYLTQHQDLSAYATKTEVSQLSDKINTYTANGTLVPNYWLSELDSKANDIQVAMEKAGRNKSAFLWYTDAHWVNGNSKISPLLLNYLYMNTPMNKVNFGGDIIGDTLLATREEMKYLYEWRKMVKDLPNHHSVFGNHDMFDLASVDYENDNYRYSFLLASEETSDQVWGNGNYYYIDNPSEKTRYLYIAYMTSNHTEMMEQGQFICDALKSVNDGWHIVAIAHRWWQYSSSSTPTTGSIPTYETEILDVFDKYNSRTTRSGSNYFTTQDFTSGKGKVEFCIGGHIHVDYDIFSNGGIPIIITTADTNQNRVPTSTVDSGTIGTTTESAVFGIIADYNEEVTKITVVGVGRGTSRVVRASNVQPQSISNITYSGDTTVESTIDKSKFAFTINYSDGTTSSVNGANSVTPTTITTVGNNSVTITYVENGITLSATTTIVGTAKPTVNLFDKNDSDLVDTGRFNSSQNAVAYQQGQLVTGFIEGQIGDTFTIKSDKSQLTNGYTGTVMLYDASKKAITSLIHQATADGGWTWSSDGLSGTITIPSSYSNKSHTGTTFVRFCIAYTNIDSIVITKS